ncbi:MAG: hypothetical protein HY289_06695 [Planctomycetes bacterium]|nr:hypothetical protein [Planctomycetota bacterium]
MGETEIEIDVLVELVGVDAVLVLDVGDAGVVEQLEERLFVGDGNEDGAVGVVEGLAEADVDAEGAGGVGAFESLGANLAFDEGLDLVGLFFLPDQADDELDVAQERIERLDAHDDGRRLGRLAAGMHRRARQKDERQADNGKPESTHGIAP